jgi:hypothetical protein
LTQTWRSLIPGQYTIAEKEPGADWTLTGVPVTVTVNPGDDPLQIAATHTSQDLSGPIPPLPGAFEYLFGYPYSRELVAYHPSGTPDDPNWRGTSLWWPCEVEGSTKKDVGVRGLWCAFDRLLLGVYKGASLLDILWPAESDASLFVLRPGMAHEVAFVPVRPGPFGIVVSDTAGDVRYRFMYAPQQSNTWEVVLVEEKGKDDQTTYLVKDDLQLTVNDYSNPYHLRIELQPDNGPVFKWMQGGASSAEWKTLPVKFPFEAGDRYRIGLVIGEPVGSDYSSVVINEAKLEWSSLTIEDSSSDQARWIVDDTCDESDKDTCGDFEEYGPKLQDFSDSVGYGGDMHFCLNPSLEKTPYPGLSYAEWCVDLDEAGDYDVAVHIPSRYSGNQTAVYEITNADGEVKAKVPVNQQLYYNEWVHLGTFYFEAGQTQCVRLIALTPADVSESPTTGFDAVKWSLRQPSP